MEVESARTQAPRCFQDFKKQIFWAQWGDWMQHAMSSPNPEVQRALARSMITLKFKWGNVCRGFRVVLHLRMVGAKSDKWGV